MKNSSRRNLDIGWIAAEAEVDALGAWGAVRGARFGAVGSPLQATKNKGTKMSVILRIRASLAMKGYNRLSPF